MSIQILYYTMCDTCPYHQIIAYMKKCIKTKDFTFKYNRLRIKKEHLEALSGKLIVSNLKDLIGNTVYHYLAYSGSDLLKTLVKDNKYILYIENREEMDVIEYLSCSGNYELLKEICLMHNINVNDMFLYNIVEFGSYETCIQVIEDYPEIIDDDIFWFSIFSSGNYGIIKKFIDKYPHILDINNDKEFGIWSSLMSSGDIESIKQAITDYPHIKDIKNEEGISIWSVLKSANYSSFIIASKYYGFNAKQALIPYSRIEKELNKMENKPSIENIPNEFLCPISKELMKRPVTTQLGHIYDELFIEEWLETKNTDPFTNERLKHKNLNLCRDTENKIIEFLKMQT